MVWVHPREIRRRKQKRRIFPQGAKFKHWEECAQSFLDQCNPAAQTGAEYSKILYLFFSVVHPGKTPDDIARTDVERWINSPTRDGRTPSASYYNSRLNALKSFYTYATDYEYQFRGQWKKLMTRSHPPTDKIANRKHVFQSRALTDDEMHRFFQAIEESKARPLTKLRDRALFLLFFWTARRRCEIGSLLWGDLERRTFYQCGENIVVWLYKWKGKGHLDKDDTAELPMEAAEALIKYLEAAGRWGKMKPEEPVFLGQFGDLMSPTAINYSCRRYLRAAGINQQGVHVFRHTRARATYEETGNDIEAVAKLLRHSSIDMTRRYVLSAENRRDPTAQRLRGRFGNL